MPSTTNSRILGSCNRNKRMARTYERLMDAAIYISDYLKTEVRNQSLKQIKKQTNKHVGFAVNFKAYVREVIGWHPGRNIGQCEFPQGFSWSLHANAEELSTVELH